MNRLLLLLAFSASLFTASLLAASPAASPATTAPAAAAPKAKETGEKIPSESAVIKDLHSLGLIEGHLTIFRSASPTRDLVKDKPIPADKTPLQQQAQQRMAELAKLGIKTIISFENPDEADNAEAGAKEQRTLWIDLEKLSRTRTPGITFISRPINNDGPDSPPDLHRPAGAQAGRSHRRRNSRRLPTGRRPLPLCRQPTTAPASSPPTSASNTSTGPIPQAIDEMRRLGHNWPKYSSNGGLSSLARENHLPSHRQTPPELNPPLSLRKGPNSESRNLKFMPCAMLGVRGP